MPKPKSFKYLGFTFKPHRDFTEKEQKDGAVSRKCHGIGICNYKDRKDTAITTEWSWDKFYEIATAKGMIADIYIMNNKAVVIPCENELFAYGKDEANKLNYLKPAHPETQSKPETRQFAFTHKQIEILKLALTMAEGKCFEVYQEVNKIIEGKYADSSLFKLSTDFGDLKQSIEQGELDI